MHGLGTLSISENRKMWKISLKQGEVASFQFDRLKFIWF